MKSRIALMVCLLPLAARAAPSPEELANQAHACKEQSAQALAQYDNLVAGAAYYGDFTREDLKLAKPASDAQSAAWLKTAAAYEKGDVAAAASLREQADKSALIVNRWRERIDARIKEADVAPREGGYSDENARTAPGAKASLITLFDARREAADAWCLLAEAMTPDADAERINDLREKAMVAMDEVELARTTWESTNRREQFLSDKTAINDGIKRELDQMRQLDEQRVQAKRLQLEQSRRVRQIDREAGKIEAQLHKDVEAAKREKK